MKKLFEFRERHSNIFEWLQVFLIGLYVACEVAPVTRIHLLHAFLGSHSHQLETGIKLFFLVDAILILGESAIHWKSEPSRRPSAIAWFLVDLALIFLTALRPFRVLRPILVLRQFSSATEKKRSNDRQKTSTHVTAVELIFLLIYSFVLIVFSTAVLILGAEKSVQQQVLVQHESVRTLADAVWYCVGQITLTGTQYGLYSTSGRIYAGVLLLMGLGIAGLFGRFFERLIRNSLTYSDKNLIEELES